MIELDIATAHSRKAAKWKNRKWQWEDLLERCRETTRTRETVAEYARMSREEQSDVKDVGGFVGGYLNGGSRKTQAVLLRSMATLDIDFGTTDVWDDFTLQYGCAALLYSTHKHTPENPRFRLVIPFNRPVKPDEYEPACRRIAASLGIEMFDRTTYELARLFYWPSTSRDGEFVFREQDGPPIDVDELLATYRDYRDASAWPLSSREGKLITHEIRKAGDPTEKPGLIGAFCRAYTIEEAIERFLPDIYGKTVTEGRYTYLKGSVAGGLVCYEHKFAYSHHETDPAGGKLCNAFDLCRIHLFGIRDEGSRATDPTRLPSYAAMMERAGKDERTCLLLARERRESVAADFDGVANRDGIDPGIANRDGGPDTEPEDDGWMGKLDCDKNGNPKPTAANYELIALHDPAFRGVRYDLFSQTEQLPKKGSPFQGTHEPGVMDDVSLAKMSAYVEKNYGLKTPVNTLVDKMLRATATERSFHAVKDYILSEPWDGTPRVDTLFIDYLGAEDCPLNRAIARKWMVAAVTRALEVDEETGMGVKFDHIVVFYGEQGTGKSTMAETLAGPWYGAISFTQSVKEQGEAMQQSWIVEVPEFKGLKASDDDSVKDCISRLCDGYRAAYDRTWQKHPRHCVLIGATNNQYFLKDVTGNRRFWVVPAPGIGPVYEWRDRLRANVRQLWAEAYHYYRMGEPLYLTDDLGQEMDRRTGDFTVAAGDPLREHLAYWLDIPLPVDWGSYDQRRRRSYYRDYEPIAAQGTVRRDEVTVCEIINECDYPGLGKYSHQMIGGILKSLGWEYCSCRIRLKAYKGKDGKNLRSRYYKRPDIDPAEEEDEL